MAVLTHPKPPAARRTSPPPRPTIHERLSKQPIGFEIWAVFLVVAAVIAALVWNVAAPF